MEIVAWKLAEVGLYIVSAVLFLAIFLGWAVAILTAMGRFRWVPWR